MTALIRGVAALALVTLGLIVSSSTPVAASATTDKQASTGFSITSCGGTFDEVFGEGTAHIVVIREGDSGGFRFLVTSHLTGTETSGASYITNGSFEIQSRDATFSITNRTILVSKGSTPNLTALVTVGVDKDGNAFLIVKSDCSG